MKALIFSLFIENTKIFVEIWIHKFFDTRRKDKQNEHNNYIGIKVFTKNFQPIFGDYLYEFY